LKKLSRRNQTDELYEELGRAADAMIDMQQALDKGLDCIDHFKQAVLAELKLLVVEVDSPQRV
jgi:hypothetical protein